MEKILPSNGQSEAGKAVEEAKKQNYRREMAGAYAVVNGLVAPEHLKQQEARMASTDNVKGPDNEE